MAGEEGREGKTKMSGGTKHFLGVLGKLRFRILPLAPGLTDGSSSDWFEAFNVSLPPGFK